MDILRSGSGPSRDLVLAWHGDYTPILAELPADVAVVRQNLGSIDAYADDGQVMTVADAKALVEAATGPFTVRRLWLLGFSAGCQAVRAQLYRGVVPDVALCADGIHLPKSPNPDKETPWKVLLARAVNGGSWFGVSVSQVNAATYLSTRASAARLFGTAEAPAAGPPSDPVVTTEGSFAFYAATGSTGDDHMAQLRVVMPRMVRDALSSKATSRRLVTFALCAGAFALGWWLSG